MASLKRYKQSSENINRLQDIPPRFKRQKSLTSSNKQQTPMESANQNTHPSQKNKRWGDSSSSAGSSTSYQKGSMFPREGRKIVKKHSPQRAQLNIEKASVKSPSQPFVLSPMENKLFNLMRNDQECGNSALPNAVSTNQMLGLSTMSSLSQQPSLGGDSMTNGSNMNYMPSHHASSNQYGWYEKNASSNQLNSQCQQNQSFSPVQDRSINNSPVKADEPKIDYSDPDIRTIEMLRELERVADQTDVGNEENSNDKNSLVSHHLRMLMCAVDRYTQGVDDESGNESFEDERMSPQDKQAMSSPPPIPMPKENISLNQDNFENKTCGGSVFIKDNSFGTHPNYSPRPSGLDYSYVASQQQFLGDGNQLNTWNPWSTPSFHALDVYASPPNVHHFHSSNYMNDPSMFLFDNNNAFYVRDSCY